ncbi:MAG: InlB B-repeat-containing protein, partial [Clostridia bacterium]|nr:InlB B-repeat-containing protein [Clostridia bacterium]
MKKTLLCIAILTAIVLALSVVLVACGENNGKQPVNPQPIETETTVTVVYHNNDGSAETSTKTWSTSLRNPTKKRTGYNFSGWTFDEEGLEPYDAEMVEDYLVQSETNPNDYFFDLWGQWEAKTYTVTFLVDNQVVSSQDVPYGGSALAPSTREIERYLPDGWLFGGWDDDFSAIVSGKTISATLIEDTSVTVEFVGGAKAQSFKGKRNEYIPTVQDLSKAGYLFEGWFNASGAQYERGVTTFQGNDTYTARWSLAPIAEPGYDGEIALTYGDDLALTALEADVIGEGITYSYAWLQEGQLLSDSLELEVNGLQAGVHEYTLQVTATARGFEPQVNTTLVQVNVAKAQLTATIEDILVHYGDPVPANTEWSISYSGFVNGEDESIVNLASLTASTDYEVGNRAGDYRLSADGITAPNYDVTVLAGTLAVQPRRVLITTRKESPDGMAYNGDVARVTLTVKKGNNNFASEYADLFDEDSLDIRFATTDSALGEYSTLNDTIRISSIIAYNKDREVVTACYEFSYDLVYKIFEGSITGFTLPREEDLTVSYNGAPHSANVVANDCKIEYSVNNGEYSEDLPEFTDVGTYAVRVRLSRPNYKDYNTRFTFRINKAELAINATAADLIYGDAADLGFVVEGDTFGTVIDPANVSLTTVYAVGSNIGHYEVEIEVDEDAYPNFSISTQGAAFDVSPKAIEVKLASGLEVVYGEAIEQATVDALLSVTGMIEQDAPFVTVSSSYSAGQVVGDYHAAITTAGVNANYSFVLPTQDVKVLKRNVTLSLTLDKAYNGQPYSRTYAGSLLEGSFLGDTFSGVLATRSGDNDEYQAQGNVLSEDFVWNQDARFVNAAGDNVTACYNLIYNLKVTIANRFIPYAQSGLDSIYDGAFHAGLVTPENEGATVTYSVDGINYAASLEGWTDVGLYNVSFRITQPDWTDTTGSYVVSIAKRAATITLQGAEITYGDVKPVLPFLTEGFVEGELDLAEIQVTCLYEQRKSAGQYEIGATHAQMNNYNITIVGATLTVQPKALEVSLASGISVVYGNTIAQAQLDNLLTVVGLTDWDDNFVTVSADYSAGRVVGAYDDAITTAGVNANYTFALPTEDIQVTKRALTLEVGSTALTYGDLLDVSAWNYSVVEGLYGDHEFDLTYATDYLPTTGFGLAQAAITAQVQADEMTPNYEITVLPGSVDVARRAVSIKVNDYARIYGEAFDASQSEFVLTAGEMVNVEVLAVAFDTDYTAGDPVGNYQVSVALTDDAVNANYEVSLTMGALAVSKRQVSLTVGSTSLVYGSALDLSDWT